MTTLSTDRPAPQLATLDTFDFATGYRDGLRAAYAHLTDAYARTFLVDGDDNAPEYAAALSDLAHLLSSHGIDADAEERDAERRDAEADTGWDDGTDPAGAAWPTPSFLGDDA